MKRLGPGRVRRQLAEKLAKALTEMGRQARTDPEWLWPNQGFWRCQVLKADVCAWIGQFEIFEHGRWQRCQIHSWETMSECVRGFDLEETGWCRWSMTAQKPLPAVQRFRALARSGARF